MFGRHWLHLDVPRHLHHFSPESLGRMLQGAGFAPAQDWRLELEYDLAGWTQSALNALGLEPNLFFRHLQGRKVKASRPAIAGHYALAAVFLTAALPLTWAAAAAGRGSTLIVSARAV
jgi:hypothetical protein